MDDFNIPNTLRKGKHEIVLELTPTAELGDRKPCLVWFDSLTIRVLPFLLMDNRLFHRPSLVILSVAKDPGREKVGALGLSPKNVQLRKLDVIPLFTVIF